MTKMLDATCEAGVVKVADLAVECTILTQGTAASSGILFLNEGRAYYVATNTTDIETFLAKVSSALTSISGALTALVGGPWSGPPPVIASQIAQIAAIQSDLDTLKGALK